MSLQVHGDNKIKGSLLFQFYVERDEHKVRVCSGLRTIKVRGRENISGN